MSMLHQRRPRLPIKAKITPTITSPITPKIISCMVDALAFAFAAARFAAFWPLRAATPSCEAPVKPLLITLLQLMPELLLVSLKPGVLPPPELVNWPNDEV